jgi:tetratricopeptide (TPR) repeat protein
MLHPRWLYGVVIAVTLGLLPLAASVQAPDAPTSASAPAPTNATAADSDRQEAMRLYQEHKFAEAAEWWQKVAVNHPDDMDVHEALGASFLHRAAAESDQKTKISDRLLARAELVRAQKLGDNSDLCRALLSTIPEDGRESPAFNAQAMELVVKRIKQLSPGAMEAELGKYAVLLELKPGNYFAAEEIGLNYVQLKQWDKAGEWYAKAVQIEPANGGAYGNWVEALISAGKMKEAREKLIQGLLVGDGTYINVSLRMWLSPNHLELKKINIKVPYEYPTGKTGTMIVVDPAWLGKNDGRDAWLMYPRTRRLWKNEKYFNEFHMIGYRHSLAEEVDALSQVVAAFNESLAKGNVKEPDPALVLLSRFQAEGLLEAFILLVERDKDVNIEFYRYLMTHRDKLMEFADKYIVPPLP